jgi:hypothetical protein
MAVNVHQVATEKRLKSHDEPLMLIIPVVGRYNMHRYCDRWLRMDSSWVVPHWALLDGPKEDFLQLSGF